MAGDSALTVKKLSQNSFKEFDTDTQQLLSSTGAFTIDMSTFDGGNLLLFISRPAGAKNPTVVIEDGAQYVSGAVGNVTKLTTEAGEYFFGPFETSRFADSANKINITKSTTDTVIVYVRGILVP